MTGLAFPSDVPFDCETSHDYYGTHLNNDNNIPIDPALGGPVIDPALIGEGESEAKYNAELPNTPHCVPLLVHHNPIEEYSAGPQGDPFAQQPVVYYAPEVERPEPHPKHSKRKKRPVKGECGHCRGNDRRNRSGQPEPMLTCEECGSGGHPSCMELDGRGETLQSYGWKCNDCKSCEICQEKGKEDRMLFCDFCDRGWHMDCMQPPLEEVPKSSKWHCPKCPPVGPLEELTEKLEACSPIPAVRGPSVASSSGSNLLSTRNQIRPKGKGKAKTLVADESDLQGVDVDIDVKETPTISRTRGRPKSARKTKPSVLRAVQYSEDDEELLTRSTRPFKRPRVQQAPPAQPPKVRLRLSMRKGKHGEREEDESLKGLFDDILSLKERDTAPTTITHTDEQRFERSRRTAEEKMFPPPTLISTSDTPDIFFIAGPSRPTRSSIAHLSALATPATLLGLSSMSPAPSSSTPSPFSKTDAANLRIRTIRFGQYDIQTWYDAPFPEEYANIPDGRLWICEFCLKYMKSRFAIERHWLKCKARHPPGDEIYRDSNVSIFEVDGRKNKIYCQNLCLLSKMFLDHKSLFYDVEPFLFYVMTEVDVFGARFVGYFSKEKRSPKDYNVSCIMTLPVRQRQGWGNLLIDFSYLLSKKEQRAGSPEKPLSGLGALGYKNYWTLSLMRYLQTAPDRPQLEDISTATSMTIEDIFVTLTQQGMISAREVTPPPLKPIPGQSIKFPKGRKNGVARKQLQRVQSSNSKKIKNKEIDLPKGPFVPPTQYEITWDRELVNDWLSRWEAKGYLKLRAEKLRWSPYVLTRKEKEQEEAKEGLQAAEAGTFGNPIKIPDGGQPRLEEVPGAAAPLDIFDYELVGDQGSKDEMRRSRSRSPSVLEIPATQMEPRKKATRSRSSPASTPRRNGVDQPRFTTCGGRQTLPTTPLAESALGRKLRSRQGMDDEKAVRAEEVGAMLFSDEVVSLVVGQDERRVVGGVTVVDLKREDVEGEDVYDADAEGELEEVEVLYID